MTQLQWISRDIAAMLRKFQFRAALGHLEKGTSAKQLKSILIIEEGDALETHRKGKIPYDKPLEIPVIINFPKSKK